MNVFKNKKFFQNFLFYFFILLIAFIVCENNELKPYKECPREKPVQNTSSGECFLGFCSKAQYDSLECNITNPNIKTQYLNQFLSMPIKSSNIHSSIGTNELGDVFLESSTGEPLSEKQLFRSSRTARQPTPSSHTMANGLKPKIL